MIVQKTDIQCIIQIPKVSTRRLTFGENSSEKYFEKFSIDFGPPITVDVKVNFNKDVMKVDTWYPFSYRDEEYLAVKTSEKVIEIYKIKK